MTTDNGGGVEGGTKELSSGPSPLRHRRGSLFNGESGSGAGGTSGSGSRKAEKNTSSLLRSSLLFQVREGIRAAAGDSRVRALALAMATGSALSSWGYLLKSSAVAAAVSSSSSASSAVHSSVSTAESSAQHHSASSSAHRQVAFAKISVASAAATAALQAGATGRALGFLGPAAALAAQPLAAALGLAFVALCASAGSGGGSSKGSSSSSSSSLVAAVGIAEVTRKVVAYVLSRPAREALFARLPPSLLYESKLLLDALAPRAGDAAAALWSKALTAVSGFYSSSGEPENKKAVALSPRAAALAGLPLAAFAAWAAVLAGRVAFGGDDDDFDDNDDDSEDEEGESEEEEDDGVP